MRKYSVSQIAIIFLLLFCCLCARLGYLMLARGEELSTRAEQQMSRSLDYYQYARGDILDRQGRAFTSHKEACLVLIPPMLKDVEAVAATLSEILGQEQQLVFSRIQALKQQMLSPAILKTGLSAAESEAVRQAQLPGVLVLTLAARYGQNPIAPHIVGSVQAGQQAGRVVGVSGIELQYDEFLRDRVDEQVISWVDATGRLSSEDWRLLTPQTVSRHDIYLTLDKDYQELAERALAPYEGACVVLDPHTGDILAAASTPGFDAYGWQQPATSDAYVNKAFAYYPPASTFKILLALAAADRGLPISMQDFCCEGSALIGGSHTINCWNRDGHGMIDLAEALAYSCNSYFASLGWELGGGLLREYLARCGLEGQQIGGYQAPDLATLDFNQAVAGDMANVSIGENGVRLSPLLVAQLAAVCANGGYAISPRLVRELRDQDGELLHSIEPQAPKYAVSEAAALEVSAMLRLAVSEGTVKALGEALLPVAAKTGTSEGAGVWCAGFAPYGPADKNAPRWAIAVYVANGLSGGQEAAAVFKRLVDDLAMLEGLA